MPGACKGKGAQKRKCAPDFSKVQELDEIDGDEQAAVFWCPVCRNYVTSFLPYDHSEGQVIYSEKYAMDWWSRLK